MRIAHVITRLIVGGAQENTIATVLGLHHKPGVEMRLIAGPSLGPEGSLESEVAAVPGLLTVLPHLVRPIHPWHDVVAWQQLARWFRQYQPRIVHTHSGKAGILGRLAAHQAGVPVIIHTLHGPSFGPFQGAAANGLFRTAERLAGRYTTHFISVAHAMTRQYLAAGVGRPGQYTRIVSGFPLAPFLAAANDPAERARWRLRPGDFVIGKIARLFRLKGHDDLIDVMPALLRQCPQARFLLVGDGPWRRRFEDRIRSLGLADKVRFTGLVAPAEIPRLVGIMDVLVHLSRREGLPRSLAQALAAGRPVVAYDCDGAGEVCLEGETGYRAPLGDHAVLLARLGQLAGDPVLRERLGRQGQRLIQDLFPVEKMIEDIYELYCRLARE